MTAGMADDRAYSPESELIRRPACESRFMWFHSCPVASPISTEAEGGGPQP
jgi:hypothetical protein